MKLPVQTIAWLYILSLLGGLVVSRAALAGNAADNAHAIVGTIGEHVDADKVVYYSTGINPQDYPCARAGIIALYEKRAEISGLSRFHPKRIFMWVADMVRYYATRFMDFLMGLMNPDAVMKGVRAIQSMARGGNPLDAMDRKIEGWVNSLNPRNQFVLKRKIYNLIHNTTNADGSCKLGES